MEAFNYCHITTNATTTVSSNYTGVLHSVVINTTANGTITISDAKGTIAVIKASVLEGTYLYDVCYSGPLRVVNATTGDITVTYL